MFDNLLESSQTTCKNHLFEMILVGGQTYDLK